MPTTIRTGISRFAWFVGIWPASVLALGEVSYAIRLTLKP
ncbi:MAG: DUF2474 family protein [Sphingomonas sp.]